MLPVLISVLPVLLVPALFYLFDSRRLISLTLLSAAFVWGILVVAFSYYANTSALIYFNTLTAHQYPTLGFITITPFIEEFLKALFILLLIKQKKIVFIIDGAFYGLAVGTGFAIAENVYFFSSANSTAFSIEYALLRGFGAAFMHTGSMFVFSVALLQLRYLTASRTLAYLLSLIAAVLLHSAFNLLIIVLNNPWSIIVIQLVSLPISVWALFKYENSFISGQLDKEFDTEIKLLTLMHKGEFSSTAAGKYILTIRERFSGETLVDIMAYIRNYLELSLKAKSLLMLREMGMQEELDDTTKGKLQELRHLEKAIGRAGLLAIEPIIPTDAREAWKLSQINRLA